MRLSGCFNKMKTLVMFILDMFPLLIILLSPFCIRDKIEWPLNCQRGYFRDIRILAWHTRVEIVVQLSRGVNVSVFVHLSLSVVPNLAVFGSKFPGLTGSPVLRKCILLKCMSVLKVCVLAQIFL